MAIPRFRDQQQPAPFDGKYAEICLKTDKISGGVTLTIAGTGTTVIGTNLQHACERLALAYQCSEYLPKVIHTLTQSYGITL